MENTKKSFSERYFDSFTKKAILPGVVALVFTLSFVKLDTLSNPEPGWDFSVPRCLLFLVLSYLSGVAVLKFSNWHIGIKECATRSLWVPAVIVVILLLVFVTLPALLVMIPIGIAIAIRNAIVRKPIQARKGKGHS